jgi:hypothetical protein
MRQQLRSHRTFVRPTLRALTALGVGVVFVVVSVSAAHATAAGTDASRSGATSMPLTPGERSSRSSQMEPAGVN